MSRFKVGLTGGIGSGKSEVSKRFEKYGIHVVDADIIARQVVEPGQPALDKIIQHFGSDIVDKDGQLLRAKLREIIFSDATEKAWLENLLHPVIRAEIISQLENASSSYAILSSPLLLETGQDVLVNRILVVDASEDLQLARASQRDKNNLEQIKAIMKSQMPREQRRAAADDVIHNHGDKNELDEQVNNLHQHYLKLAEEFL
jgi:dephospho-CoA kinase